MIDENRGPAGKLARDVDDPKIRKELLRLADASYGACERLSALMVGGESNA